jgi:hypothetical protein
MLTLGQQLLEKKRRERERIPVPSGVAPIDSHDYVRLIAQDGLTFYCHRDCAAASKLLQPLVLAPERARALNGGPAPPPPSPDVAVPIGELPDGSCEAVRFPFVPSHLLEHVVQYCHYKTRYEHKPDKRPPFHIPPAVAQDLLRIATLLQL